MGPFTRPTGVPPPRVLEAGEDFSAGISLAVSAGVADTASLEAWMWASPLQGRADGVAANPDEAGGGEVIWQLVWQVLAGVMPRQGKSRSIYAVSYTHLTLPTNREV